MTDPLPKWVAVDWTVWGPSPRSFLFRESIFRLGYFSGFFLFVCIVLTIMLYCTFRRIGLLSCYTFFGE